MPTTLQEPGRTALDHSANPINIEGSTLQVEPKRKFRVFFVTEDDPLYVISFFDTFFAEYPHTEFEIVGITVLKAFHENIFKTFIRILRFYGSIDFARLIVRYLGARSQGRSIGSLAKNDCIELFPTDSVNDPHFVARLRELKLDVIVSVAAPEIFRSDILSSARLGCVNIHSGRLPKYRGMMPNFWQLHQGETQSTVTVHEMALKLDAGSVLGTFHLPLRQCDSLHRVIVETKREGGRFMIRILKSLADGTATRTPLDMTEASYFTFPTFEDVKVLRARGHRLL